MEPFQKFIPGDPKFKLVLKTPALHWWYTDDTMMAVSSTSLWIQFVAQILEK